MSLRNPPLRPPRLAPTAQPRVMNQFKLPAVSKHNIEVVLLSSFTHSDTLLMKSVIRNHSAGGGRLICSPLIWGTIVLFLVPNVLAQALVATEPDTLFTSGYQFNALFNLRDSDSDGYDDFMTRDANCDQTGQFCNLRFFYGNGTGYQPAPDTSNIGAITTINRLVNTADLTGDGRKDILYHYQTSFGTWGFAIGINPGAGVKAAWKQTGFWLFSNEQFQALSTPTIFGTCDFDGDGNDDVIYVNQDVTPLKLYVYRRTGPVSETVFASSWTKLVVSVSNPEAVAFPADRTHQPALVCYPPVDGLPARLFMVSSYCSAGESACPAVYSISYAAAANSVSFTPIALPTFIHTIPHTVSTSVIPLTTPGKQDIVVSFASDQSYTAVILPGPVASGVTPVVSSITASGARANFAVLGSLLNPATHQYVLVSTLSPTTGGNQIGYYSPIPAAQFVTLAAAPTASGPIMGVFFPPQKASLAVIYYSGPSIIAHRFCWAQACPPLFDPPVPSPVAVPIPVVPPVSPVPVSSPIAPFPPSLPPVIPTRYCPVNAANPGVASPSLTVSFDLVSETFSFRLSYPLQRDETAGFVSPLHYLSAINFQFKNPCFGVSYLSTSGAFNESSGWTLLPLNRTSSICDFVEMELSGVPMRQAVECLDFSRATVALEGGLLVVPPKTRAAMLRQYAIVTGSSYSGVDVWDNLDFRVRFPRVVPMNVRPTLFRVYYEGQATNIAPSIRLISSRVFLRDGAYNLELRFNATVNYPYSLYPDNFNVSADYTAATPTPWFGFVSAACRKTASSYSKWNGSNLFSSADTPIAYHVLHSCALADVCYQQIILRTVFSSCRMVPSTFKVQVDIATRAGLAYTCAEGASSDCDVDPDVPTRLPGPSFWTMQVNVTDVCSSNSATPRGSNPLVPVIRCGASLQDLLNRTPGTPFRVTAGMTIKFNFQAGPLSSGFVVSGLSFRMIEWRRLGSSRWQTLRTNAALVYGSACSGSNLCVAVDPLDSIFDLSSSEVTFRATLRVRLSLIMYDTRKRGVLSMIAFDDEVDQVLEVPDIFQLPAAASGPVVAPVAPNKTPTAGGAPLLEPLPSSPRNTGTVSSGAALNLGATSFLPLSIWAFFMLALL